MPWDFHSHPAGYPVLGNYYELRITVSKSCYDWWQSFEQALRNHEYWKETLFERELRGSWKYIVQFHRGWNTEARRWLELSEIIARTEDARLREVLENGTRVMMLWSELEQRARTHGAEELQ